MRLFDDVPTRPNVYLDVYITSVQLGKKVRMKPIEGQYLSSTYFIECSRKLRKHYPIGTVYKVDVRLVTPPNRKPYLATLRRNNLERAIEFYDHNRKLQVSQHQDFM